MIVDLFNVVKNYGTRVRNERRDGLESWSIVKPLFADMHIHGDWFMAVTLDNDIVTSEPTIALEFIRNALDMRGGSDDNKDELWECKHFYHQLMNIPANNAFSATRLFQIAYNIGQLESCIDTDVYSQDAINFYMFNRLDTIDAYVNLELVDYDRDLCDTLVNKIASC